MFFNSFCLWYTNIILYGVIFGLHIKLNNDQSEMSLSNLEVLKQSTQWEILSDWSIYLTVLHMNGWSIAKMNERLPWVDIWTKRYNI
jgi:hypothetical protein